MEAIGWISATLLALCALPQAIKTATTWSAKDLSLAFLLLWFSGEIAGLAYVTPTWSKPLIFNYSTNIILVGIMLTVKLYDKRK